MEELCQPPLVGPLPQNQGPPPPHVGPIPQNQGPPPLVGSNGPAPNRRSMEELCQPSINGRGGPIAPIPIQAADFGLHHHMIQQVQNSCQFHGLPGDDVNRHIDNFLEITQHMKQNGVSDDALRLTLFPYSLTHQATTWYDRLPRNSIRSFHDIMRKILSKYFPPSMVTKLRNEIIKFIQEPHESLFEALERYKLSIDRCPNHNMPLVTQIDTFYNGLTLRHRDTINVAARGTFMQKTPEEYETSRNISSTTTESPEVIRQLELMNKNFLEMMRQIQPVKSVTTSCETCGGPHSFTECPAVDGYTQEAVHATTGNHNSEGNSYQPQGDRNMLTYRSNYYLGPPGFNQPNVQNNQNRYNQNQGNYQAPNSQRRGQNFNQRNNNYQAPNFQVPNYQAQVRPTSELTNYMKSNEATLRVVMTNMKTELRIEFKSSLDTRTNKIENQNNQIINMLANLTMQNQSPSGSGSLPSNTVTNPREDLKAITTRSGVAYDRPTIPPTPIPLPKEVEHELEATKDKVQTTSSESIANVQPPVVKTPTPEPEVVPKPKPNLPYPLRLNNQKLRERDDHQMMNQYTELVECLALADLGASINLMPLSIWRKLSLLELTPTQMILELADRSTTRPTGIAEDVFVRVGKTGRALIYVYGEELTLRVGGEAITFKVGNTSRYSYNDVESINQIDFIDVACEEYSQKVLGFFGNSKSGNPTPTSEPIIVKSFPSLTPFEGGDFILEEIGAYLASDSVPPGIDDAEFDPEGDIRLIEELLNHDPYSSLPLKDLKGEELKSIESSVDEPSVLELRKLNDATRKDHFPLPFMDQMLERLAENECYCFLDDSQGTFQRCMMAIFHDMIEETMEVFMDDFSEKCHFIVKEDIVLGHKISKSEIEVDRAKVDVIAKLPPPTSVKGIQSFLGHAEEAFETLKKKLTEASILVAPDWDLPFEIMCDAGDFAMLNQDCSGGFSFSKNLMSLFVIKKGVENLAADHLSRLEYPHRGDYEKKKITKTFPLETLGMISSRGDSSTPWFADFSNYHAGNFVVKAKALPTNDARVVVKFLKSLFARFGTPRAIISDRGTHFCNNQFAKVMLKYGVTHRLSTAYRPQTSGQVEVSNRGLKRILERIVGENRASWSDKLDDHYGPSVPHSKHPSGVRLISLCTERLVIFLSNLNTRPIGP
ncbi:reverse transcriptase domain-containing protein [Tanacetum coccineum]